MNPYIHIVLLVLLALQNNVICMTGIGRLMKLSVYEPIYTYSTVNIVSSAGQCYMYDGHREVDETVCV